MYKSIKNAKLKIWSKFQVSVVIFIFQFNRKKNIYIVKN